MQLSRRLAGLNGGGDDGWGVFTRARAMIAAGERVTELTIGEHDIRTAAPILQEMHRAALAGHTGYAAVAGIDALRRAVAARCHRMTGVPTAPENVLITPGGQAALFAAHAAVCDPGDAALIVDPYYATYPGTLRGVSALPRFVRTRPEDGFRPRYEAIAAQAGGARSLLINTPNNPTGGVYGRETLAEVARACRDFDLWLISDEVYDSQVWDGAHVSPRALPGMDERTLVVGSMSKSHAMTGSRCGWVIGPREVIAQMIHLSTVTTYGVPGYIQEASAFALGLGPAVEAEIGAPFERRRDLALDLLSRQTLLRAVPPDGAMYLMVDISATGLSGEDFAHRLLESERVAVMPGESFGTSAAGHVRIAMTVADEAFGAALATLIAFAHRIAPHKERRGA